MPKPPSRLLLRRSSKYGVGKEIGGAIYVHRQYEYVLGSVVQQALANLPVDFPYVVVKYKARSGTVSFIQCDDFDGAPEPTVGNSVIIDASGDLRRRAHPRDPEIYHHKWLFVADDYAGFDVTESKRRSMMWLTLDEVDRSRIGRKSYWEQHVVPRLDESTTTE